MTDVSPVLTVAGARQVILEGLVSRPDVSADEFCKLFVWLLVSALPLLPDGGACVFLFDDPPPHAEKNKTTQDKLLHVTIFFIFNCVVINCLVFNFLACNKAKDRDRQIKNAILSSPFFCEANSQEVLLHKIVVLQEKYNWR